MKQRLGNLFWLMLMFGGLFLGCNLTATPPEKSTETLPQVVEETVFNLSEELQAEQVRESPYPLSDVLLVRDTTLRKYYRIDATGIHFFRSLANTAHEAAEFIIYPDEYELTGQMFRIFSLDSMVNLIKTKGRKPWPEACQNLTFPTPFPYSPDNFPVLKGLRVALDPGHIAGNMEVAEIEGKYMKMKADPQNSRPAILFNEANLTLATAHLIRQQLEAMGATVLMTRTQPGLSISGLSWEQWRKSGAFEDSVARLRKSGHFSRRDVRWWKNKAEEKDIMKRFFTPGDLLDRARIINDFQPHLTLIIHYNVDSPNWEKRDQEGFFTPTETNYLMAFTPGSFMEGELSRTRDRVAFLRLLVSQDMPESVRLCDAFVSHSLDRTGVRIINQGDQLGYLERACILTEAPGVYARNLTLTRLIAGPVCYGESLCQDNRRESLLLNQRDLEVSGMHSSPRLREVADAYVQAVLEFVKQ